MAGVSGCIKYSMFIFNFLFWLSGILILAMAIWLRVSKTEQEFMSNDETALHPHIAANILIAVGSTIMILGFLGCCGAIRESRCMLLLFFIGLLLILLLQLTAGIIAVTHKSESEHILNVTLHKNVELLSGTNDKAKTFQKAMNHFQKQYKCCGLVDGAADWGQNFQDNYESCECTDVSANTCVEYEGKHVHQQTCMSFVKEIIIKHMMIIIGIAFGLLLIEVLGLVFSMILFCQIGEK